MVFYLDNAQVLDVAQDWKEESLSGMLTNSPEKQREKIEAVAMDMWGSYINAIFLRIDFPMIPYTEDYKIFTKMARYGKRLVKLHLMMNDNIKSPVRSEGKGLGRMERL